MWVWIAVVVLAVLHHYLERYYYSRRNTMFESIECEQMPGCCTVGVVHDFPSDETVDKVIAARATELQSNDEDLTKRAAKRKAEEEITNELTEEIESSEDSERHVHVAAVLTQSQGYALDALKEAGYTVIGTYHGNEGEITFLATGLNLRRQR